MIGAIVRWVKLHRVITIVAVVMLVGGGYYYKTRSATAPTVRYVTSAATRGTLTVTVDGTGQISASNQIDIKTAGAGKVIRVLVKPGDKVVANQVLAQLDATDAYKSVRDAQLSLESAQLSLQKLTEPADALSITQAENALTDAKNSQASAQADLAKSYDDGFTAVANAFADLPGVMSGLQDTLHGNSVSQTQTNLSFYADALNLYDNSAAHQRDQIDADFQAARTAYQSNYTDYTATSRQSSSDAIEALVTETYTTSKQLSDLVKALSSYIQHYKDVEAQYHLTANAIADTHLNLLVGYASKLNSAVSNLLSISQTIKNDKLNIDAAGRTIVEKTQSFQKLQAGTDALDVQSAQLTVRQRQAALSDAQANLANYTVRAPMAGVIAAVSLQQNDTVSSGAAAATLITERQMAQITLNEVDVAKIAVGKKVTLTFDALPDLDMSGTVTQIDTIGSVSQGVVSYNVQIGLDAQDDRIRPGMSIAASVITQVHPDVLMVPNSAVKTSASGVVTVQVLVNGAPQTKNVTIGLANDSYTEIDGGLSEGDAVVTQTISSATTQTAASGGTSLFGALGGGTRVGGAGGGSFTRTTR